MILFCYLLHGTIPEKPSSPQLQAQPTDSRLIKRVREILGRNQGILSGQASSSSYDFATVARPRDSDGFLTGNNRAQLKADLLSLVGNYRPANEEGDFSINSEYLDHVQRMQPEDHI